MIYSLPFGLTQKPMNHYFEHGIIKFNIREGVLHYTVKQINKSVNAVLLNGIVKTKEPLDKILTIKTLNEIHDLEEVIQ